MDVITKLLNLIAFNALLISYLRISQVIALIIPKCSGLFITCAAVNCQHVNNMCQPNHIASQ